eukprot:206625-Rhodomonas_salina.1
MRKLDSTQQCDQALLEYAISYAASGAISYEMSCTGSARMLLRVPYAMSGIDVAPALCDVRYRHGICCYGVATQCALLS